MAYTPHDWQISCKILKERGTQLLQSGQWTDCTFLVGAESNQISIKGHKLFLAMASPVFEAMFYGGIPERNDPISILDVQPEAFKALLEYIYTDNININSFEKACELCYAAKKYMLPHLVQECTNFLWSDLHPKNACRAYEFAKLFEEPVLMDKCLQIICTQTPEVLSESSFEDIELATMIKIFEQDSLNIESELDLFNAAVRYSNAATHQCQSTPQRSTTRSSIQNTPVQSVQTSEASTSSAVVEDDKTLQTDATASTSTSNAEEIQRAPSFSGESSSSSTLSIRNAIQKIRFLTLSPQQFAEGPGHSGLLTQSEAFAILMNISSPRSDLTMPPGFTSSTLHRSKLPMLNWLPDHHISLSPEDPRSHRSMSPTGSTHKRQMLSDSFLQQLGCGGAEARDVNRFYCQRSIVHQTDCLNTNVLDCSVTFTVDKNICVIGVQIPTQVLGENPPIPHASTYSELLYAHLLDADGSRLTYTHYTSRVPYNGLLDITFNRPFYIQRNKVYKVGVVFNKFGWYPMGTGSQRVACDNIFFNFGVGQSSDSIRDGLIRSIIFTF